MRTLAATICFMLTTLIAQHAVAQQPCPTLIVSTNDDVVNGDTSNPCALIADPGSDGISLREALLAANNATGSGTITINFAPSLAGATIALTARFAPITRSQITLTGPTSNGQPNITLDATNATNPGPIFFIATSNFTMTGINVTNLPTNFNAMQIGGFSYNLTGQMVSSPPQICCFQINGNAFSNGANANSFAIFVSTTPNGTNNSTISDAMIDNNTFSDFFEAIDVQAGGNNNVIRDVNIYGNSFLQMTSYAGVELSNTTGSNNKILRANIWQNSFSNSQQGVFLDNNAGVRSSLIDGTIIARNVFTAVTNPAVGLAAGVSGGAANNTISNTQIVDNIINQGSNMQQSGGIYINDNQDSEEINNKVSGVSIVNNTFAGPFDYEAIGVISTGDVSGVSVVNDIFYGNQVNNGVTPSEMSYSIINQSGFTGVNNNFNSDPMFVNASNGNFELQSGSPAIGAGTSRGAPAIDIDCQARGAPPSIGAYEFEGPDICPATYSPPLPLTVTTAAGGNPLAVAFWTSGLSHGKSYIVNFGDGSIGPVVEDQCFVAPPVGGGQGGVQCSGSATHTYAASGTYTATLVSVSGGRLGASVTFSVGGLRPIAAGGGWWRKVPAR